MSVDHMTKGCLAVLKRALQDIIELPQPDGHDCDDDQVIELLSDMMAAPSEGGSWSTYFFNGRPIESQLDQVEAEGYEIRFVFKESARYTVLARKKAH